MSDYSPVKPYIKLSILLLLWILVFVPVFPQLFDAWMNHSNSSHGVLVPFICLYLIWQKKEQLVMETSKASLAGLWILIGSMVLYALGYAGGVAILSRLMIVSSLIGIVIYVYGLQIFKIIAFPLLFGFFMVPVPESFIGIIAMPLQLFATNISAFIIYSVSIPVYQEGNMLYFAQTQLEVAESCSGLRSITSLSMLSILFVYLEEYKTWQKIVLLLSAIPVAILANIIRVSGTGILAHFYGDQVARGFLHDFSGMAVFVFGLAVLFIESIVLKSIGKKEAL